MKTRFRMPAGPLSSWDKQCVNCGKVMTGRYKNFWGRTFWGMGISSGMCDRCERQMRRTDTAATGRPFRVWYPELLRYGERRRRTHFAQARRVERRHRRR